MIETIAWCMIAVALFAAYLTAQKTARQRLIGFALFCITNGFWACYNWGDWPMVVQFGSFFLVSSLGVWNNRRENQIPVLVTGIDESGNPVIIVKSSLNEKR